MSAAVTPAELRRVLTPAERSLLVLVAQREEPGRIAKVLRIPEGEIGSRVAAVRDRIERMASRRSAGKSVTVPVTLPRPPKEAVMSEEHVREEPERATVAPVEEPAPVAPEPEPEPEPEPVAAAPEEGFADRVEREAKEETARVLEELVRLRFRGDQVARIVKALGLELPEEIQQLIRIGRARPAQPERPRPQPETAVAPSPAPEVPAEPEEAPTAPEAVPEPAAAEPTEPKPAEKPAPAAPRKPEPVPAAERDRDFLDAGPYRKFEEIERALRAMKTDITAERIVKAWGLGGRHQAERVIREFYPRLLVVQKIPARQEAVAYRVRESAEDQGAFTGMPVPSVGWEAMPAWANVTNKTISAEVTARQQGAVVAAVEEAGRPIVPREAMELLQAAKVEMPFARVADYLREIERAGVGIRRTGKMRRARGQEAGRTSVEYAPLVVRKEGDVPAELLKLIRDHVCRRTTPFSARQVAEDVGCSVEDAERTLESLEKRGIVKDESVGELALFTYLKPESAGRAAERDAERRKAAAAASGNGNGGAGGVPIAGTGRSFRTGNQLSQQIVDAALRAGGRIDRLGNDHFRVFNAQGQSCTIAGTPSNGGFIKDKAKARKIGIPV